METIMQTSISTSKVFISPDALLSHWQGHRRLTRKVIEAFPEDKLFSYAIGGMRPFADIAKEIMGVAGTGIRGIVTDDWTFEPELDYHSNVSTPKTKEAMLRLWDRVTDEINTFWPQITEQRFLEVVKAFGQWEN
ncbi:MAG: DinB family protein, partial [Mucilaginibacter sp.]